MLKKINKKLYYLSSSKFAVFFLAALSFLEAFILPISPLMLLIPLTLLRQNKAWLYVNVATIFATLGSIVGYFLGSYFLDVLMPFIQDYGLEKSFQNALINYSNWGILMLFISSIFPIPFKFFTIISGSAGLNFPVFLVTVLVVRWLHFAIIPISITFSKNLLENFITKRIND